VGDKNFYVTS
jgi:Prokaryotic E2 family A